MWPSYCTLLRNSQVDDNTESLTLWPLYLSYWSPKLNDKTESVVILAIALLQKQWNINTNSMIILLLAVTLCLAVMHWTANPSRIVMKQLNNYTALFSWLKPKRTMHNHKTYIIHWIWKPREQCDTFWHLHRHIELCTPRPPNVTWVRGTVLSLANGASYNFLLEFGPPASFIIWTVWGLLTWNKVLGMK